MKWPKVFDVACLVLVAGMAFKLYSRPGRNHVVCSIAGHVLCDFWTDNEVEPWLVPVEWYVAESFERVAECRHLAGIVPIM
jgi:hypothetical protein